MSQREYVQRFDRYHRFTHGFLMVSFLGLALTGMPLLFSDQRWAWWLSRFWGGFERAATLHRMFAVVMIVTFVAHVARLVQRVYVKQDYGLLWGPRSMVPQPRDVVEMFQHFRWFVGQGPRPTFGHFTYWEKFDYWAVFWGMLIIGGSGLMLWFPTVFATFLPGWIFNIAMLVHGEEALLAVGFIFTIHFFNGHIRPEKFPMDLVVFTGRMPLHEFADEHRGEYDDAARQGRLPAMLATPPSDRSIVIGRVLGTVAVIVGLTMVVLIMVGVFS